MADLDDFFAKKDKKKGRSGKTVLTAEALVRELEEGARQVEYTGRKENKTSATIELLGLDTDDADWKDFEDIEKRDYTGLKIKEISLQDQNDEDLKRLQADQNEGKEESSVWKTKDGSTVVKEEAATNEPKEPSSQQTAPDTDKAQAESSDTKTDANEKSTSIKDEEKEKVKKGDEASATTVVKAAYRPPAQRNKPIFEPGKMTRRYHSKFDTPDINNKMDFPGLG